jgi:2-C-methyl-D-erythritol 4-phosphate cytidylyltransferase
MGADRPKQYLALAGATVLEHTLARLCTHPRIHGVLVCISADDGWWPTLTPGFDRLLGTAPGGAERADSVLGGLRVLSRSAAPDDWVLVHDAVRPCLRHGDIDALIAEVGDGPDGGLLGVPVSDTVKRVGGNHRVVETVPREGLWRALTPQMFRLDSLALALEQALAQGRSVTDEASAVEHFGGHPRMVLGHADNIKITVAGDLALAELFLRRQQGEDA